MKKYNFNFKVDIAVILTVCTGISYASTYLFLAAKFTFYRIPFEFLRVDIESILFTVLLLSPIILYLIWSVTVELKSNSASSNDNATKRKFNLKDIEKMLKEVENNLHDKILETEILKNEITDRKSWIETNLADSESEKELKQYKYYKKRRWKTSKE